VRGKQQAAERIERRDQRQHQREPAATEGSGAANADAAADARLAP
jgi:hypothetical protein